MPILPANIKVGFYQMKIEMFVPNPLRCFKCQRFGHGQTNCKCSEACFRCGEEGHDGKGCPKEHKCKNCKGDHMASSKQCPIWIKEKEIQKIKAEKRITYHEAKKLVNMYSIPKPNLSSYATALKSPSMKNMSTQVCQNDIFPHTSVVTTTVSLSPKDKSKINSTSTSSGSTTEVVTATYAAVVAVTSDKPAAADTTKSSGRCDTSPRKNKSRQYNDLVPKGAKDPVTIHNKKWRTSFGGNGVYSIKLSVTSSESFSKKV
ncbi:uncharacterized protein LOC130051670 [Ostrea edulis]|uniref:uncharacterized protein LOC130051670 n=1 Tax=Ostrea edulis TaxID=37623 RepID=UPI0024AEC679|nr:uncharacterized protein LOC130051670 [Ostrea edulis]